MDKKNRLSKKAQIKMFETLAILFIFFILLTFGFIFYARIQKTTLGQEAQEAAVLDAIEISQKASFLPDVQCSEDNVMRDDCVDLEKVKAMASLTARESQYYYNIFGFSTITVKEVYPEERDWNIYDNSKDSSFTNLQLPVSIYDPVEDTYLFGYIDVKVFR